MGRKKQSGTERSRSGNGANLGFEEKLWAAADKMRGHMDAGEYKHVALGLIFLKYISDAFQERYDAIKKEPNADPEDRDEYMGENVFWVPPDARWGKLQAAAKSPEIGKVIDNAMDAIEKENRTLKGVLPKDFARPALDKTRLGELIDLIGTIELVARDDAGLFGPKNRRSQDILGQVYMYFLGRFAAAEGKAGGEAFTPESIVKLLVEMIEPYRGRVGDWCCGSGGMFVQSEKFVEAHGGRRNDLSVFGQESNPTTWRLCRMNLAIRGIEANLGPHNADSFHNDLHKDVKADFILANPPFNVSDWGGDRLREDPRWKYGVPPVGNANFAWVQLLIYHLAPNGVAGIVLANGSMSSNQSGEGEIRRAIVEADLVDCMIAMPGQLFYNTAIPVCLWFIARNKGNGKFRDRRGQTLFIDARKLGRLTDRIHRELSDEEIARISTTYHAWRREKDAGKYADVPGFCKSATSVDIASHGFVVTPGRYVGAEIGEDDGRALPRENEPASHNALRPVRRVCETGKSHSGELERVGIWKLRALQTAGSPLPTGSSAR